MTVIRQQDLVDSVAGALQYISYYHPEDYITNLAEAYAKEESHAAKDAMAQILINSRMCAEGHRPICQDTGVVNVFLKIGMDVRLEGPEGGSPSKSLQEIVDEGVRKAYLDPDNTLRASMLADPAGARKNTRDNTPSVVNVELVPGEQDRDHGGGQGRRVRGEIEVRHAESVRLDRGLGAQDGAHDGRGVVSSGNAGDWHWRHCGEGDAAGQAVADGSDRYPGPDCAGTENDGGEAARGALRQGEPAGHRGARPGRADHGAGRESPGCAGTRGQFARCHDSQLRGDAACAPGAGRVGSGLP